MPSLNTYISSIVRFCFAILVVFVFKIIIFFLGLFQVVLQYLTHFFPRLPTINENYITSIDQEVRNIMNIENMWDEKEEIERPSLSELILLRRRQEQRMQIDYKSGNKYDPNPHLFFNSD